eukprot:CAMPEP_0113937726 /NCGR_PEP_ID=MMETSP1339-20121228/4281_1 /TAXON_ID=94617 /ORGANISM="Fibrocapsa japonica" /LENGTH=112 /DNA_ID=CAMNT_0000940599 /DNA_START=165 /DNA_END=503 /DNA_ORIENTATION=- /assembly_acc=CAM_ASM_000762
MAKSYAFVALMAIICMASQALAFVQPAASMIGTKMATAVPAMAMPEGLADAMPAVTQQATDLISQLPTQLLSLEVTFAAYLAVLLGTFVPVTFLIVLYIQSEARKAASGEKN